MPGKVVCGSEEGGGVTAREPIFYPLGDHAVAVRFGEEMDPDTHHAVGSFTRRLDQSAPVGTVEYIAATTTVTVLYDALDRSYEEIVDELKRLVATGPADPGAVDVHVIEVPVCYGLDLGPDLDLVASHSGLAAERVVEIHCAADYVVHMIGFAPGFPYLGGLDERIATPRRDSPRARVPAGSVGIAGNQTGIYSIESPGGWQLIGRTPLRLFSPTRQSPSLLHAGDRVRFVAIARPEFDRLARSPEP